MIPDASFVFPKWTNHIRSVAAVTLIGGGLYALVVITFGFSPQATDVGYQPQQPIPYSHALHAGELGIDCRYCHTPVEETAHATIPPTQVCMNCHSSRGVTVRPESQWMIEMIREKAETGEPIEWVRIHDLPDYAYFNHSAHVRRGVGCVSCHGRIDEMQKVYQFAPLSMQWCLNCHRNPEKYLRPLDRITDMVWTPTEPQAELGARLRDEYDINPSTDCSTCHR